MLGFQVTVSESFTEAKNLRILPMLLFTELRLGEFNGLQLVFRYLTARPDTAAIVTSRTDDPVLTAEAERMGATFLRKPIAAEELRASVLRMVLRDPGKSVVPIRAPFERRRADRRKERNEGVVTERRMTSERRLDPEVRITQLSLN